MLGCSGSDYELSILQELAVGRDSRNGGYRRRPSLLTNNRRSVPRAREPRT
jgi:hypothetical protein